MPENEATSTLSAMLSERDKRLLLLHRSIQRHTSAITKDLQTYEAFSTLLRTSGAALAASGSSSAPQARARLVLPTRSSPIVSSHSLLVKGQSGGTATSAKRPSSSMTSGKETSGSKMSLSGQTAGTSSHPSKVARSE